MAIRKGQIGLDVQNGRAVHEIGSGHMEHRTVLGVQLHVQQLHGGQTDGIGAEGGTGGKDAHTGFAPQPGWQHRGRPTLPDGLGKDPQQPQVGIAFHAPQSVGIAVFRLKNNGRYHFLHQTALAGDSEFGCVVIVNRGDGLAFHGSASFCSYHTIVPKKSHDALKIFLDKYHQGVSCQGRT